MKIFESWFPKPKPLNALDAYTITKYGIQLTEETLYSKCTEEIEALMRAKSAKDSYTLVFDLDENLPQLSHYLVNYYSELGFSCFILDATVDCRIEVPQLYLSWRKRAGKLNNNKKE